MTGINIGIVIGVSKYSDSKNNLPGCKNDAEAINNILKKTEKYQSILYINNDEPSAKTKELIANYIIENRGKTIEEFFFYYSGHGEFLNDEFYYILSDFDIKKRNQSSLRNSEMDDLIKSLSPHLVIKVIDACQSGTTYIKDINFLSKYFNETKTTFNKCYFLNSSLNNQSSYQDKNISLFTNSFIGALKQHNSAEIRYRDIIDVISDEFAEIQEQTPFFVIQADFTEKFCSFSSDLREYLKSFTIGSTLDETKVAVISLRDLVKKDAKEYVDKAGALTSLEVLKTNIEKAQLKGDLLELYHLEINFLENHFTIPKKSTILNWINKNKNEYFATPVYYEDYDNEGNYEEVLGGFDLKIDAPFKAISIDIMGNYPNLSNYNCTIAFLLSKKSIRFFYFITNYFLEGWEETKLNTKDIQWVTVDYKISDTVDIISGIDGIVEAIQERVENDLKDKFKVPPTSDEDPIPNSPQ